MLDVGRTGLAEVWCRGRDRECCGDCFKLLAAEETTFSDSLQKDRNRDVDRPWPRGRNRHCWAQKASARVEEPGRTL